MSPLVLFRLNDGRSIIAATAVTFDGDSDRLMAEGSSVVFVSEEKSECMALSAVRECSVLTARDPLPPLVSVYAFAAVTQAVA